MCLMSYANNKGADQPAYPRSLISAFVVRCLDSIISLNSIAEISSLHLASVAAVYVWPGRKHPKSRFVMARFIFSIRLCSLLATLLEVVRNVTNNILLLILMNLSPNKSYPKPVLNPDILIISLLKNDKILVLAKILFLNIFPIQAMEISYIKMQWWDRHSISNIFQTWLPSHV